MLRPEREVLMNPMWSLRFWPVVIVAFVAGEMGQLAEAFTEFSTQSYVMGILKLISCSLHIFGLYVVWTMLTDLSADQRVQREKSAEQ